MVIHQSFADFVLFLYVHIAHADDDFHQAELGVIREKMSKLYPFDDKIEERLQAAIKEYKAFDKSKLRILFKDTFSYFPHIKFAQKYKVYADMYDIVTADGEVDEAETQALAELKEIIDISAEASHQG
ncbi:MAG TPA: TerB family tellurite resistance protein [Cyclobacteriaceae bacterium]|nr:TerB family tellurite resistance protein [Cyclobacteriaceae bacterium]